MSPSICLRAIEFTAFDKCTSRLVASTTFTLKPGEISTLVGGERHWDFYVDYQNFQPLLDLPVRKFNFADLPCPPLSIMSENWYEPAPGYNYRPIIAGDQITVSLLPLFSSCSFRPALNDLPKPLGRENAFVNPALIASTTTQNPPHRKTSAPHARVNPDALFLTNPDSLPKIPAAPSPGQSVNPGPAATARPSDQEQEKGASTVKEGAARNRESLNTRRGYGTSRKIIQEKSTAPIAKTPSQEIKVPPMHSPAVINFNDHGHETFQNALSATDPQSTYQDEIPMNKPNGGLQSIKFSNNGRGSSHPRDSLVTNVAQVNQQSKPSDPITPSADPQGLPPKEVLQLKDPPEPEEKGASGLSADSQPAHVMRSSVDSGSGAVGRAQTQDLQRGRYSGGENAKSDLRGPYIIKLPTGAGALALPLHNDGVSNGDMNIGAGHLSNDETEKSQAYPISGKAKDVALSAAVVGVATKGENGQLNDNGGKGADASTDGAISSHDINVHSIKGLQGQPSVITVPDEKLAAILNDISDGINDGILTKGPTARFASKNQLTLVSILLPDGKLGAILPSISTGALDTAGDVVDGDNSPSDV